MEIALGWVFGQVEAPPRPERVFGSAREALEDVILQSLARPPCGVAFSGGRDSSAVLAIAARVARREGLPDPIPITRVFVEAPRAEERAWQELVVEHLGLRDWQRIHFTDELDVLGPFATNQLRRFGLLWSPLVYVDAPLLELVRGGALIDGEGGDEVLGHQWHRIRPIAELWRRSPSPGAIKQALRAGAPRLLRTRHVRRRESRQPTPWLKPPGREAWIRGHAEMEHDSVLSFARSVRQIASRRAVVHMTRTRRALAETYAASFDSPLLAPAVVDALAREGGFLGPGPRTVVLGSLVGDLLPEALLARETKAEFGEAYLAGPSRAFARSWDGAGLDAELVDPAGLRSAWLAERVPAPTISLLQAAWLAAQPTER